MPSNKENTPIAKPASVTGAAEPKTVGNDKSKPSTNNAVLSRRLTAAPSPKRPAHPVVIVNPSPFVSTKVDRTLPLDGNAPGHNKAKRFRAEDSSSVSVEVDTSRKLQQTDQDIDEPTTTPDARQGAVRHSKSLEIPPVVTVAPASPAPERTVRIRQSTLNPSQSQSLARKDLAGRLPLELWFEIATYLRRKDLCVVSRICEELEHHCRRHLYRAILHPGPKKLPLLETQALFGHIIQRPDLALHVRTFNCDDMEMPPPPGFLLPPSSGLALFFRALNSMQNIEVLAVGPDVADFRMTVTLPRLRMLKVSSHVPERFISRHTHLEALDIAYDGFFIDLGAGDELKFLRCSYSAASCVFDKKRSRQFAKDALLQVIIPKNSHTIPCARAFLRDLARTPHPPGMVDLDRFTLRQLGLSVKTHCLPPSPNEVLHLRAHIEASDIDVVYPGAARTRSEVRAVRVAVLRC